MKYSNNEDVRLWSNLYLHIEELLLRPKSVDSTMMMTKQD